MVDQVVKELATTQESYRQLVADPNAPSGTGKKLSNKIDRLVNQAASNGPGTAYVTLELGEVLRSIRPNPYIDAILNEFTGGMVAGGFVLSLLRPDIPYGDIDFFFSDPKQLSDAFARLTGPAGVMSRYVPLTGYISVLERHREMPAITLVRKDMPTIQLVKIKWYNTPMHLMNGFDISVSQFAIDLSKKTLVYGADSLLQLLSNMAVIKCAAFPADLATRLIKYTKKGFDFDEEDVRKIFTDLSDAEFASLKALVAVKY